MSPIYPYIALGYLQGDGATVSFDGRYITIRIDNLPPCGVNSIGNNGVVDIYDYETFGELVHYLDTSTMSLHRQINKEHCASYGCFLMMGHRDDKIIDTKLLPFKEKELNGNTGVTFYIGDVI